MIFSAYERDQVQQKQPSEKLRIRSSFEQFQKTKLKKSCKKSLIFKVFESANEIVFMPMYMHYH